MANLDEVMNTNIYQTVIGQKFLDKQGAEQSISFSQIGTIPSSRIVQALFDIDEIQEFVIKCPENLNCVEYLEEVNQFENSYYIDYKTNMIIFSDNLINYNFEFKYFATGMQMISANKIFTALSNTGRVTETLEDIVDSVQVVQEACAKIENIDVLITTLETEEENLTSQLENVQNATNTANAVKKQVDTSRAKAEDSNKTLNTSITNANNINTTLSNNTDTAKTLNTNLVNNTNTANTLNTTLVDNTARANTAKSSLDTVMPRAETLVNDISKTDNYYIEIPADNLVLNSATGYYEYTLNHQLDSLKCTFQFWDNDGDELVNFGHKIDKDNYLVANDEKINIIVTSNKGYWGGTA